MIYKHLVFALKYEGIDLLFFKKLFEKIKETDLIELLTIEPQGQYRAGKFGFYTNG